MRLLWGREPPVIGEAACDPNCIVNRRHSAQADIATQRIWVWRQAFRVTKTRRIIR
jgi:hypothetical protein